MADLPSWVLVLLTTGGAFAGAWGAAKANIDNLDRRMQRVEKWIDNKGWKNAEAQKCK